MRYRIDCRKYPSDVNCTLVIAGAHDELIAAEIQHLVSVHGFESTPDLTANLEGLLEPEPVGATG